MSAVEIEIEAGDSEPVKELTATEKESLLAELKQLLLPNGSFGTLSPEARKAAVDAVMSKLKGEKED